VLLFTDKRLLLVAMFAAAAMRAPLVFAAGSGNLGLGSNVTGTCRVTTPPGALNFGNIDPSGLSPVTATITFAMKCTKGTQSTAAADDGGLHNLAGTKRMQHSATATAFLPYSVSYSGSAGFTGQGFGPATATQVVTVTGTVTPAQFQNALVTISGQKYTDTVTITVNP
jgi:spore coat protein U-like protein